MSITCFGMIFSSSSFLAATPPRSDLGLFGSSTRCATTLTTVLRFPAAGARPDWAAVVAAKWKSHRTDRQRERQRDSGTERRQDGETEGRSVFITSLHLFDHLVVAHPGATCAAGRRASPCRGLFLFALVRFLFALVGLIQFFSFSATGVIAYVPARAFQLKAGLRKDFFQPALAFWATCQRLVTHLLHNFQMVSAFLTIVFINGHIRFRHLQFG